MFRYIEQLSLLGSQGSVCCIDSFSGQMLIDIDKVDDQGNQVKTDMKYKLDADFLVTGHMGGDFSLKIWEIRSGNLHNTLTGHNGNVFCVKVYRKKIYSGSRDGTIKVWDCKSLTLENTIDIGNEVKSICFHDGTIIAGCDDSINIVTNGIINKVITGKGTTQKVIVYQDKILAACENSVMVYGFDGKLIEEIPSTHRYDITDMWCHRGMIMTCSNDKWVRFWKKGYNKWSMSWEMEFKGSIKSICYINGTLVVGMDIGIEQVHIKENTKDLQDLPLVNSKLVYFYKNKLFASDINNNGDFVIKTFGYEENSMDFLFS